MSYHSETASILKVMGYTSDDYNVSAQNGVYSLTWYHADQKPTEQQIIDNALPWAKSTASSRVKAAAAKKYGLYASSAPGKDAVYAAKQSEAQQYALDQSIGAYMQARINQTGETAAAIAAEWSAKSSAWNALAAQIDAIQDKATIDINAQTDWTLCESVADAAISQIEAL